jgi:AAA+ ATPase superfamily predicted ATPase
VSTRRFLIIFFPKPPIFCHFGKKIIVFPQSNAYLCERNFKVSIMNALVGREAEIKTLTKFETSGKPEFVAIYGRRRVGKTFLVKRLFDDKICFSASGTYLDAKESQLENFALELSDRTGEKPVRLKNWTEAFWQLEQYIKQLPKSNQRRIIFLDELPWFDTQKSGFIRALDYFWNHFLSNRDDCMLIVCGSATSWMVDNLINDKGGLHNRITHEIHLYPFTLREMELYMKDAGFKWNRLLILQTYMILGGVPYYLDMLDKDESFPSNIDNIMFSNNAPLRSEFNRLYDSLFGRSEKYKSVISALSSCGKGLTRKEIAARLKLESSGNLSQILEDLVNCDFIRYYNIRKKSINSNSGIYQLTDFFTIFHFEFLNKGTTSTHYWTEMMKSQKLSNWQGLAFERVCMAHIEQIKHALHIDSIYTEYFSWRSNDADKKAQIDMVIERADNMTNICEMKYDSQGEYSVSSVEEEKMRNRMNAYRDETETRNGIILTLVTTYGLKDNTHSGAVDNVVTLDNLFA